MANVVRSAFGCLGRGIDALGDCRRRAGFSKQTQQMALCWTRCAAGGDSSLAECAGGTQSVPRWWRASGSFESPVPSPRCISRSRGRFCFQGGGTHGEPRTQVLPNGHMPDPEGRCACAAQLLLLRVPARSTRPAMMAYTGAASLDASTPLQLDHCAHASGAIAASPARAAAMRASARLHVGRSHAASGAPHRIGRTTPTARLAVLSWRSPARCRGTPSTASSWASCRCSRPGGRRPPTRPLRAARSRHTAWRGHVCGRGWADGRRRCSRVSAFVRPSIAVGTKVAALRSPQRRATRCA